MSQRIEVIRAFTKGARRTVGSLATDGHTLTLRGNPIASRAPGGITVSMCGWDTVTTRKWIGKIPGVSVYRVKGQTYLNEQPWDGDPTFVPVPDLPEPQGDAGKLWDTSTRILPGGDPWRPVEEPVHAVAGANDTGMWGDSPCRSDIATRELELLAATLRTAGIPTREKVVPSCNVFMVRRFLIARPCDADRARAIVRELVAPLDLAYVAGE